MTTIQKSIDINAPRDVIWDVLLGLESYKEWTTSFHPGSYYEGDWSVGSTVRFLGPSEDAAPSGMATKIIKHQPNEHILMEHFAMIKGDELVTTGPDVEGWFPSNEEYTLTGGPESHTLSIRSDTTEEYFEFLNQAWDQAIAKVKDLAEERA